ncbi:flagellar motor switch protein FliN/FliY [Nocardioides massiliensis]|uniref:Flagellar motor switch protein FliN/FliY n=2 Tax=Nocardioides massiliensis TaxID=1325935 RepID=A0ABT9NNC4_9ACTN|nr:flagellar motor switch protein FliN [Nocardioides massiliensis]MDP9821699.1 flagellar motor switch protein FliN/FliY [Nocardioides massiliensis]
MSPTTADPQLALPAAQAAAAVLPSADPLSAGTAQPGTPHVVAGFAGAVAAALDGGARGQIAVLVGQELVSALSESPLGQLDLAAAVQPALDAAGSALGCRVEAGRQLDPHAAVALLGESFVVVPLGGVAVAAALLVADAAFAPAPGPVSAVFTPDPTVLPAAVPGPAAATATAGPVRGIELLHGVVMDVTVELGRTRMSVRDLLALTPGTVLELDRAAGSPADLLVNGRLIARGEVVVVDEDFGLRVTEIVDAGSVAATA